MEDLKIKKIARHAIVGLIQTGLICTVEFIKKNGDLRVLNGRMGVHKWVAGEVRTTDPDQYLIIHEQHNKEGFKGSEAYRNVNIMTIQSLIIGDTKYIPRDIEANEKPAKVA